VLPSPEIGKGWAGKQRIERTIQIAQRNAERFPSGKWEFRVAPNEGSIGGATVIIPKERDDDRLSPQKLLRDLTKPNFSLGFTSTY
jgi:hypothetical protein